MLRGAPRADAHAPRRRDGDDVVPAVSRATASAPSWSRSPRSVAARGHEVHVVAPWHPLVARGRRRNGVHFHFYRYAPLRALNVFGYAAAMRADVRLRGAAYVAAPLALAAGWRTARRGRAAASRDGHARPLGHSRRRDGRRWRRRRCRSSSACTAPTSSSPRRSRRRASPRGGVPPRRVRDRLQRRSRAARRRARRRPRAARDRAVRRRLDAVPPGRRRRGPRGAASSASATACRWSSPPAGSCARRGSST